MLVKTIITTLTVQLHYYRVVQPLGAGSCITVCSFPCITLTAALKDNSRSNLWPTRKYHTTFHCWKVEEDVLFKKQRFITERQIHNILTSTRRPSFQSLHPDSSLLLALFPAVSFYSLSCTEQVGICLPHFNLRLCQDFPPQTATGIWTRYFYNLFLL